MDYGDFVPIKNKFSYIFECSPLVYMLMNLEVAWGRPDWAI